MYIFRILLLMSLLICPPVLQSSEKDTRVVETVERFVAAFNAHDSNRMANLVTNDIEWLSIMGKQISVEAKGKSNLVASMDDYFNSCSTCQSELSEVVSTPTMLSAIEIASWQGKNGPRSQRAISVYEFSGGLISRVYYFPAEK